MVCLISIYIAIVIIFILFQIGPALMCIVRKFFQGGQFNKDHIRIDGKVVIITGCNTGIGKCTAMDLARRGAKVYMACRDESKCEEARQEIIKETGNENVFNRKLDLASFESVRNFVAEFLKEESQLDILINNAGVMNIPKTLTEEGFECQIGVNHLGHFLLTNLLLDALKKAAPSRIVVVSSIGYMLARIKRSDLNSERWYCRLEAYCQSKLANVLFTRHLAKKLEGTGVTVNVLHPGVIQTEIARHFHPILIWLLKNLLIFKTPDSGAQTTIYAALDPDLLNVSGEYFSDCKIAPVRFAATNDDTAEWLWNKSVELTA